MPDMQDTMQISAHFADNKEEALQICSSLQDPDLRNLAQIAANVRPTLQQGWEATNSYTSGAQASASDFYAKSRDYTSKTWSAYEPHVSRFSSDWKVRSLADSHLEILPELQRLLTF